MADSNLEGLDAQAEDPSLVAYIDKASKQLVFKQATNDQAMLAQRAARGLQPATPEDIDVRRKYLQNTTAGAQAGAAGKLAANVATFGLAGFDSEQDKQQIKDFRDASPTLATLSEVAGAVVPGVVGGGVGGAVMEGLGASARAAQIGGTVMEEVAQSTAIDAQHAMEEERGIDLGNVLMGIPLALGVSAAGRLARGVARRVRGAGESGLDAAASDTSNALARGQQTSAARRSAGAAGAGADTRPPMTEAEVRSYAGNRDEIHAQVERFGGDAIEDASAGTAPAMDAVHNIGLKKADIAGRMADADDDLMADFAKEHGANIQELADKLDVQGQKSAARQLYDHVAEIEGADSAEDLAIGFDRAKRTMDRLRTRYGSLRDTAAEGITSNIDDVVNPIRDGLEQADTWGKVWAEKQGVENGLWSGDHGIIRSGAIWQKEFLQQLPGAAGSARRGLKEVPVFKVRGDIVEHTLAMKPRDFELTMNAWKSWIDNTEKMSQLKVDLGVQSVGTTPVMRLQQALNDMKSTIDELKALREVETRGRHVISKAKAEGPSLSNAEKLFDAAQEVPFGPGAAVRGADKAAELLTGKSLRDRLFQPKIEAPVKDFTRAEAGTAIAARRSGRGKPSLRSVPRGPSGGGPAPEGNLAAQLGALGRAGAASVRSVTPVTDSLAEISDHSRAIQERAALGLVSKESRPPKLPPLATRFKEGAPDLGTAFQNKVDDLRKASDDPQAFVDGMVDTFGKMAEGGHDDLFTRLVARVQIGTQYLMANLPPSVGISMVRPDGIQPDSLAIMKFAAMYNAVFSPGDVVYDVATGDATPTQIKALREVHPDIYGSLRAEALKQIGQAGQNIPFETLRSLDNLFDFPGVAGLSFSPSMTKTMADAYAQSGANAPKKSLGGESVIAPPSATKFLTGGPSTLQS